MQKIVQKNTKGLKGVITIPSDKSISHRAVMLSSLAKGKSVIKNFSKGADPISTLKLFKALGIDFCYEGENTLIVKSNGVLSCPIKPLDCGNSGTTMRLVSGILAGSSFTSTLIGDESLSKRPMKRIIEPLSLMGAVIKSNDNHAPLTIHGNSLCAMDYISKLASAQVKSAVLLAGLRAEGVTRYTEPYLSRNHTELMLKYLGAEISVESTTTSICKSSLEPKVIEICGDISSAAYFITAALIVPNSDIILKNVCLNPTRTGLIDVVKLMGGSIEILEQNVVSGEVCGDLRVKASELKACVIEKELIPRLIDELPIIAVLASQAQGQTIVKDASDLRNKESDRIKAVVCELSKISADISEREDGFVINGQKILSGGCDVECYHDHRLAMSLYVAALICEKPVCINGFEWVDISFPEFEKSFFALNN